MLGSGTSLESVWELVDGKPVEKVQAYHASGDGGRFAYVYEKVDKDTVKVSYYAGPQAWELAEADEAPVIAGEL